MATAVQISQRIDPLQTRNAAGTGNGNHGKDDERQQPDWCERGTGAREAGRPRRPAASAVTHAKGETGRRPMREPSRLETASVPCDSHAAAAVRSSGRGQTRTGHVECWSFYQELNRLRPIDRPRDGRLGSPEESANHNRGNLQTTGRPLTRAAERHRARRRRAGRSVLMTWPLASGMGHLGRTQNSGDGRFAVWNVAWVAHALTTSPADLFDANIFYPHRRALAFSEANIGAGTLAVPVWAATHNPFAAHNSVVLMAFSASVILHVAARTSADWRRRPPRQPRRSCSRSARTSSPTPPTSSC